MMGKHSKLTQLDMLVKLWSKCMACELCKGRHKIVYWRGSPDARLFAIGEGPGADEDEQGTPFVGSAGHTFDGLLKEAGVDSVGDIFITNLVMCRPPGNRAPTSEEVKACRPRLVDMISVVEPKVLLLLGGTAAKRIAGITQISRWRGELIDVEMLANDGEIIELLAVPTFHPSYLNRSGNDPKIRRQMIKDIKLARKVRDG